MRHILIPTIISLLFAPLFLHAQETFPLLVSDLPFIGSTANLAELLKGIFRLTLGIAITATVFIIVFNGIKYMASDVIGKKEDALAWIREALWGLVLAFSVVLILNTINPNLTQFDFLTSLRALRVNSTVQPPGGGGGDEPPEPGGIPNEAEETAVREQLSGFGVTFSRPCRVGEDTQDGCVTLYGLSANAISGIARLKMACDCSLRVTGGVEPGHQTHEAGLSMVDFRRDSGLTSFIRQNGTFLRNEPPPPRNGGPLYSYNGSEFWDEPGGTPHWHVCFETSCRFR